jgi:hypothetical protein
MENSCDPLLHGKGKVAVSIRAERNRSFSAPKGTGAAVSLTRASQLQAILDVWSATLQLGLLQELPVRTKLLARRTLPRV